MKSYTHITFAACAFALLLWGSCTEVMPPPPPPPPPNGPDTTSHDFMFEVLTFGGGSSSSFYDAVVVNDTLIYVVGEVFVKDSAGETDPIAYSYAKWNGVEWRLGRLYYGQNNLLISRIRGIFFAGPNDIWLAAGSIFHWDGVSSQAELAFSRLTLSDPNATIEKVWGTSSSNLYGVGNAGTIVHYNGASWQQIATGTMLHINDIWGNSQQEGQILAVAPSPSQGETKILSIVNQTVVESQPWPVGLAGVWISPDDTAYVSGIGGVWRQTDTAWQPVEGLPDSIIYASMRGNADNDLFLEGDKLMHFSGNSWYEYPEIPSDVRIQSLAVKGNMVVAVGLTVQGGLFADKAAIVVGKRFV